MKTCVYIVVVSLWLVPVLQAATVGDWPAWRGGDRSGISLETGLADTWPEGGPPLVWQVSGMGEGLSTPSVAGGQLFLMGNRDNRELLIALDRRADGRENWYLDIGPAHEVSYRGPRSTPTVDGERVYALGVNGDLVCADTASGSLIWKKPLREAPLNGQVGGWGYCESVLIDGPWLICTPGGSQATLAALDKRNGSVVWQAPIGDTADYSSPIKARLAGVDQYVQFTHEGVLGVRAKDGEFLWRYGNPANSTANCSTPVAGGDTVFAASGYGTGGGLAKIERDGEQFEASEVYFSKKMQNHHGGMILLDGYLYGCDDPGLLTCLEFATGKVMWQDRAAGKCSVVYAEGKLFCRGEDGPVSLVAADPNEFRLLGRFDQPQRSGQPAWPHPVVASGRLYIRDQDVLFCYDVSAK